MTTICKVIRFQNSDSCFWCSLRNYLIEIPERKFNAFVELPRKHLENLFGLCLQKSTDKFIEELFLTSLRKLYVLNKKNGRKFVSRKFLKTKLDAFPHFWIFEQNFYKYGFCKNEKYDSPKKIWDTLILPQHVWKPVFYIFNKTIKI